MIEEGPAEAEFFGEVGGEGFGAESFGGVVAAVKNVKAEFFGHGVGPMRAFAGDEGVHAFIGSFLKIVARAAGDDADAAAGFGAARNDERLHAGGALEARGEIGAGDASVGLEAEELVVVEEERV